MQGAKAVKETLASDFEVLILAGTGDFFQSVNKLSDRAGESIVVSDHELTALGSVEINTTALAIVKMKPNRKPALTNQEYALILDSIRDPGNLGTMIRTEIGRAHV